MTRSTLGTRVNPSGLIEDVELLGSELVQDSDFTLTGTQAQNVIGTYWTTGAGWSIANGLASSDGSQSTNSRLVQNSVFENNKTYKLTFDLISNGQELKFWVNGSQYINSFFSSDTYTIYINTTTSGTAYFEATANFIGSVTNVSVKEATIDGLARVDYTDGTGSLLVEPQRTNLVTYSEDFSNSSWTKNNTTVTNNHISPDGTENAYLMTDDATNSQHVVYVLDKAAQDSNIYSRSVFVKKGTARYVVLSARHKPTSSGTSWIYDFDTNNWTATGSSGVGQSIEVLTNGWIRLSISHISDSNFNNDFSVGISSTSLLSGASYSGSGDTLYIYGGQLELGSYPTSYIKTQGSSVTRNQDEYSKTGISDKINSEEGVLFLEAKTPDTSVVPVISISDTTFNNEIEFAYYGTNQWNFVVRAGGSSNFVAGTTNENTFSKFAISYTLSSYKVYKDGVLIGSGTMASALSGLSVLDFAYPNNTNLFYGNVRQLQIFKTALSDSELATLTT